MKLTATFIGKDNSFYGSRLKGGNVGGGAFNGIGSNAFGNYQSLGKSNHLSSKNISGGNNLFSGGFNTNEGKNNTMGNSSNNYNGGGVLPLLYKSSPYTKPIVPSLNFHGIKNSGNTYTESYLSSTTHAPLATERIGYNKEIESFGNASISLLGNDKSINYNGSLSLFLYLSLTSLSLTSLSLTSLSLPLLFSFVLYVLFFNLSLSYLSLFNFSLSLSLSLFLSLRFFTSIN